MKKARGKTLSEHAEDVIRKALEGDGRLSSVSEIEYCTAVYESLDAVAEGNSMRLRELEDEDGDE